MPAKVFISCGQATPEERLVAKTVADWFKASGYEPYIAITVQTIMDLNSGIIGALKTADYYLLINFRREEISSNPSLYRGSLYSHQELAAAYVLGFQDMLFVSQRDVKSEGVFQFIVSNAPLFDTADQVPDIVKNSVDLAGWTPSFSRQLRVERIRWSGPTAYVDHAMSPGQSRISKVLHADIRNDRTDIAARHAICRLREIVSLSGSPTINDQSVLKASGFIGYEHTIWPTSEGSFDLLGIDLMAPTKIFLHSAMDLSPRAPVIDSVGGYKLKYNVLAENFPPLAFEVDLVITGNATTTAATLTI